MSKRSTAAGFTLLEVLVVVVIIGILVTFAGLSISGRAASDKLETETARLQQLFAVAAEDAELQGVEIGFVQTERGYAFLAADQGRWLPVPEGPLRPRPLPPPLQLWMQVDGQEIKPIADTALVEATQQAREQADKAAEDGDDVKSDSMAKPAKQALKPQLLFLSSGEASEATLDLRAPGVNTAYRLEIDQLGRITRSTRGESR